MTQYSEPMAIEDQEAVVREQMRVADDQGLPILVHTPSITKSEPETWLTGKTEEGHDLADPVLDPATAKLDATRMDVTIMDEVGLADEQVVIDHAHPSMAEFVMEQTDCYLAFSIGQWIRTTTVADVAAVIEDYGPERIILDSDVAGMYQTQPFAMKRAILDLVRSGVDEGDVRKVVYENPKEVLGVE
jgi:predicted metal-dependent TIM-barrel fold hydrolase